MSFGFLSYSGDTFPVDRYKLVKLSEVNRSHADVDGRDTNAFPILLKSNFQLSCLSSNNRIERIPFLLRVRITYYICSIYQTIFHAMLCAHEMERPSIQCLPIICHTVVKRLSQSTQKKHRNEEHLIRWSTILDLERKDSLNYLKPL